MVPPAPDSFVLDFLRFIAKGPERATARGSLKPGSRRDAMKKSIVMARGHLTVADLGRKLGHGV